MRCPLCKLMQDTHSHLFFDFLFLLQFWLKVKAFIHIPNMGNAWTNVATTLKLIAYKSLARVAVAKIVSGQQLITYGMKRIIDFLRRPRAR